jgi:guanosine-3',5'-bis(diphosphate) 3'-pyrophosphohydrolase
MKTKNKKPLWQDAAALAGRAHRHQLRKDKQTPYFTHPVRVALTIACVFGFQDDQEILAAALLHDTIEDTDTDYDDIHDAFGKNVADYVAAMTKDMRLIESKREVAYDRQLADGPWQGRLIKLADVYDNLSDCIDAAARKKQIEKAKRALKLTQNDKQLAEARQVVTDLIARAKSLR